MARRILLAALAVLLVTAAAAQVDVAVGAGPVSVGVQVPSASAGSPLSQALATAAATPASAAAADAIPGQPAAPVPAPAPAPAPAAAAPAPAAATLRAGLGAGGLLDQLRDQITDVHSRLTAAITGVTGVSAEGPLKRLAGITQSSINTLEGLRAASEATLQENLGLLLDNTKELRKYLEDGNRVIDGVQALRGATCEPASFTPPEVNDAEIVGAGAALTITTGSCKLVRVANPLQLDFVLSCTEPSLSVETTAPRYNSRFVSAAEAATEECRVQRKYGVESTTTITLFDPATFFGTGDASEEVEAAAGLLNNATAGMSRPISRKATAWFNALLGGDRSGLAPGQLMEAVQQYIKELTVDFSFRINNPVSDTEDIATKLSLLQNEVKSWQDFAKTAFTVYKGKADQLGDKSIADLMSLHTLRGQAMNATNVKSAFNATHLFDNIFTSKVQDLLKGAGGGLAESVSQVPLRTLLSTVRSEGGSQQIKVGDLQDLLKSALGDLGAGAGGVGAGVRPGALAAKLFAGSKVVPGSLGDLVARKGGAGKLKDLATQLAGAAQQLQGIIGK